MSERETIDPLTLALIEVRLNSLNQELGARVLRQGFSTALGVVRDFGSVLFDKSERTVTVGNWMPIHTAGAHIALKGMLDSIGRDNIQPDDFIIGNDPFILRFGHPPDWSFVRPIFYEGELLFYHFFRGHQYDSGGAYSTCYFPRQFDCHGEGLMIPPTKMIEGGKIDEKAYSLILRNVRGPSIVRADNLLIYASMRMVEKRILDMLRSYGKDLVLAACDEKIRRTEETVKNVISKWPAGIYQTERAADWDGTTDRPVWVRLVLTVKPDDGQLIFDFSDSDPQVDFINCPLGQTWAAVVFPVASVLPPGTPRDQGLFNCMSIITKEGTVLDPVYPATSGGQAVYLGTVVTECVQVALAQVVPERASALWGRQNTTVFWGRRRDRIDPRTKSAELYVVGAMHGMSSNGAIWGYDGTDGLGTLVSAGAVLQAPIEKTEWDAPYRWLCHELTTDSAGDGQWRGGLGVRVEVMNTADPKRWQAHDCVVMTGQCGGEKFGALGILGGTEGKRNSLHRIRKGKRVRCRLTDVMYAEPGEILIYESGGGGGVGKPANRDIEKVRWDVLNECISIEKARTVYRVVIDPETLEVDYEATRELRNKLKE